jgi:hypothetical protein
MLRTGARLVAGTGHAGCHNSRLWVAAGASVYDFFAVCRRVADTTTFRLTDKYRTAALCVGDNRTSLWPPGASIGDDIARFVQRAAIS